eukprot:1239278-Amphidinium_carterae.1
MAMSPLVSRRTIRRILLSLNPDAEMEEIFQDLVEMTTMTTTTTTMTMTVQESMNVDMSKCLVGVIFARRNA